MNFWLALLVAGHIAGSVGPYGQDECDDHLMVQVGRISEFFALAGGHGFRPQYHGRVITPADVSLACLERELRPFEEM